MHQPTTSDFLFLLLHAICLNLSQAIYMKTQHSCYVNRTSSFAIANCFGNCNVLLCGLWPTAVFPSRHL